MRDESGFHKYNISANVGYDFSSDDKLALLFGYYQAELDMPANIFGGGTGRRLLRFTRFTDWKRINGDLYGQTKRWNQLTLKGNMYVDKFSDDSVIFNDGTFEEGDDKSRFKNTSVGANVQATWEPRDDVMVKGGSFIKQDHHADEDLQPPFTKEDWDTLTLDYFLKTNIALPKTIQLSASINYDIIFTGGNRTIESWNPRGSLVIQSWANSRWHIAIGKKSRMPSQLNLFAGRGHLRLEPENNLLLEVGLNQLFWEGRIEMEGNRALPVGGKYPGY